MSQSTDRATGVENPTDGDHSIIQIDREVFEALSLSGDLDVKTDQPQIVRWFESWSRTER